MKTTTMNLIMGLLCLMGISLSAQQTVDVQWGEEITEPSGSWIYTILSEEKDGSVLALRLDRNAFGVINKAWIEKYSKSFSLTYSNEIKFRDLDKKLNMEDVYVLGDELIMIFTKKDRGEDQLESYGLKINKKSGKPVGGLKPLAFFSNTKSGKGEYFQFTMSADTSKLLIMGHNPNKPKKNEKFTYWVYDQGLNPIWEKEFNLPFADRDYRIYNVQVSKSGDAFLLAKVYEEKSSHYEVVQYDYKSDKIYTYPLTFDNFWLGDVAMVVNDQDQVIIVGFYGDGAYYARIDIENNQVIVKSELPFHHTLLLDFLKPKKVAKGYDLSSFDMRSLILKPDGGVIMLAEEYYVERYESVDPNTGAKTVTNFYNYNDILYLNISAQGKLISHGAVFKKQRTKNDRGFYSSYAYGYKGDLLYIIYNDNERNFNEKDYKRYQVMKNAKNALTILTEVSPKGDVEKTPLFDNKEDLGNITRPKVFYATEGHTILLAVKGKKMRLGKVSF